MVQLAIAGVYNERRGSVGFANSAFADSIFNNPDDTGTSR